MQSTNLHRVRDCLGKICVIGWPNKHAWVRPMHCLSDFFVLAKRTVYDRIFTTFRTN